MQKMKPKLNEKLASRVKEPGRYSAKDQAGLFLLVRAGKDGLRKYYMQRVTVGGRKTDLSIGKQSELHFQEAQKKAAENYSLVLQGIDPRQNQVEIKKVDRVPTFLEMANDVHASLERQGNFTSVISCRDWIARIKNHAKSLHDKPIDRIRPIDVRQAVEPIWKAPKAKLVLSEIAVIMKRAKEDGFYTGDNPAEIITMTKQKHEPKKHKFLPYIEVPKAVKAIHALKANPVHKLALEFTILCASRSGEVRHATWGEVDLENRTWTIPASRMKNRKQDHCVPLSKRAMQILEEMQPGDSDSLVFAGRQGKPLGVDTMKVICAKARLACTVHGFRSSFATWAIECTGFDFEVREMSLSHAVGDTTYRSYQRSDLLDKRREIMQEWADHVCK